MYYRDLENNMWTHLKCPEVEKGKRKQQIIYIILYKVETFEITERKFIDQKLWMK